MSGTMRAVAAFWNDDPDKLVFILEELCREMTTNGLATPVVVDCRKGNKPPHFLLADSRGYGVRGLKGIAQGEIPYLQPSEVGLLSKGTAAIDSYLYVILTDDESIADAYAAVDDIFFLCRPKPESTSTLFSLIKRYAAAEGRYPRFHVMVSGLPKIEDATLFFVSLRDEIRNIGDQHAEILFAGFCDIDFEKVDIARANRVHYREIFKGDSFYGQLLYSAKSLLGQLETVETDLDIPAFFKKHFPQS